MFRFYSKPDVKTRVTVVGTFDNGILSVAVARCSEQDRFSKKEGRFGEYGAEKRLASGKYYCQLVMPKCSSTDFIKIAETISYAVIKTKKITLM